MCDDKRIRAAVALLLKAPMLTVGQAMRAAHFPDGESKDRTIQMQVRRALNRKRKDVDMDVDPFLTPPVGVATSVAANLSLLTTTSASSSSSSGGGNDGVLFPQPKVKRIRRTASAMQQDRMNALQKSNHYKEALKRATLEYAAESKKSMKNGVHFVNRGRGRLMIGTNPQQKEALDRLTKQNMRKVRKEQYKIVIITRNYTYYINLSILTKNTVLENH